MKKSLLFLFLLVLGVTQGWAVDYLTLPTSSETLTNKAIYRVESNTTINGTLSVPANGTVTIYIAKGKTLTVKSQAAGQPAILVPGNSTLIVTGAGTLRVYGGKAEVYNGKAGGKGAAPGIGNVGGADGASAGRGSLGVAMGTVYVRGNVIVRAARGTSLGRRANSTHGADGCVPTYAIGGGGGGGAGTGNRSSYNGSAGTAGTLYVEKSARVIYLNGKRRIGTAMTAILTANANKVNVTYTDYNSSTRKDVALTPSATGQTIIEYGFININNDTYYSRVLSEETTNETTGFKEIQITTKKIKNWTTKSDGTGDVYNPKDLVLADGIGSSKTTNLKLYANWEESSAVIFNVIHNADELMKFARMVNGTGEYASANPTANGILVADIDMSEAAWNKNKTTEWGDWTEWVPIGGISDQGLTAAGTKAFKGTFDGNGHIVSNLTMSNPMAAKEGDVRTAIQKWDAACGRAGLIGYAKGATIKNVLVKNATLWGKWNVAGVCGRLDEGTMSNCGSYGMLYLNHVSLDEIKNGGQDLTKLALDIRAAAGVTVVLGTQNPTNVSGVWSTYNCYSTKTYTDKDMPIQYNYVVASSGKDTKNYNSNFSGYTQTSNTAGTKTWIYVDSASVDGVKKLNSIMSNGELCYALNDKKDGGTAWTQTFKPGDVDQEKDNRTYKECPRPTSAGLPVYYSDTSYDKEYYYNVIHTISFNSNGGEPCDDVHVGRAFVSMDAQGNVTTTDLYPNLPTTERINHTFDGWFKAESGDDKVETITADYPTSDVTLYAHWIEEPTYLTINANQDPKVKEDGTYDYYCTFYDSERDYRIVTSGVVAYKAIRADNSNNLKMKTLLTKEDANKEQHISKVIPAGEAVILKAKTNQIQLQHVLFNENVDPELDPDNALYGSDEEIAVADVRDYIPSSVPTSTEGEYDTYGNCFVFSCVNNTLGFYLPQATTLAPHKAYVLLDGEIYVNNTGARPVYMLFEDDLEEDATGISEHKSESETKKAIFSINGMPLSKLQKGINIVGGKKVFVK